MATSNKLFIKTMMTCFLFLISFQLYAQKNVKGPNSTTIIGVVQKVDGNKIEVLSRDNYLRKLTLNEDSKVKFLSFENNKKEFKAKYNIITTVKDEVIKTATVTLPTSTKLVEPTAEMLKMTPAELFKIADLDGNGQVSYAETSKTIDNSPKHGPRKFSKADKDNSGTLDMKEFEVSLTTTEWWKLSRETPEAMFKPADINKDGVLSKKEFAIFLGKEAHLDTFFKRADRNSSGDLDLNEVTKYIDEEIFPSKKLKNIKKENKERAREKGSEL